MSVCLEIIRADGRIHRQVLGEERTTVGSSREASIWVQDAPELEPLHILVVPREQGVWLSSVRNARTPVLLDASRSRAASWSSAPYVDVGSITFPSSPRPNATRASCAQRRDPCRRRGRRPLVRDRADPGIPAPARAFPGAVPRRAADCPAEGEVALAARDAGADAPAP